MGQRIGVSKVARLMGIGRAALNKRLAAAHIETFEGKVDFEQVKCIAPELDLNDPELLRLQHIRERVSYGEVADPELDPDKLRDRIKRLSHEVAIESELAQEYRQIIEAVAAKLGELQTADNAERRRVGFELCEWLRGKVNTGQ